MHEPRLVEIYVTCVAGGGHAAADHSRDVSFGVEKRRQCLQLPGGWQVSIDASSRWL